MEPHRTIEGDRMAAFIQFVLSFGLLNQLTLHVIGLAVPEDE